MSERHPSVYPAPDIKQKTPVSNELFSRRKLPMEIVRRMSGENDLSTAANWTLAEGTAVCLAGLAGAIATWPEDRDTKPVDPKFKASRATLGVGFTIITAAAFAEKISRLTKKESIAQPSQDPSLLSEVEIPDQKS